MAQLPEPEGVDAVVVSHRWVELGRDSLLALSVTYDVNGNEVDGLIWFTEKAQNMGRRALRSLGFDITDRDPAELDEKPTLLMGAKCKVKLKQESFNGRMETKADIVIPRDVAVGKGSLKALGERIKNPPKPAPRAAEPVYDEPIDAPPPARTEPKPASPLGDPIGGVDFDDIPFAFIFAMLTIVGGALMA